MTVLMVVACGLFAAAGIGLIAVGLYGTEPKPERPTEQQGFSDQFSDIDQLRLRIGLAVVGAVVMLFLAPWPVAVGMAALGGFFAPTIAGAQKRRQASVARTEAVASWAEQLRDTIGSAAGLQEAITVTANVAPKEIRDEVRLLALGMRRHGLPVLLRRFAVNVDDPAADQVAVALILASERSGQNLTQLLSDVAHGARQEAMMRMRTETSRAQTYSDAKAVTGVVLAMFFVLLIVNRGYLEPFGTLIGQGVLAFIGAMWAGAIMGLAKLSVVRRGPRILSLTDRDSELV